MKNTPTKQPHNYHALARYYDKLMSREKYAGWRSMIMKIVKKYQIEKGKCLDLACGTGTISEILATQGFDVVGVDLSEEMLNVARKKVPKGKFFRADMRNFTIPGNYRMRFAVSFYDSLNYLLSTADLLKAFKSVSKNLESGAIFFFDINTKQHIEIASHFKPVIFDDKNAFVAFRFGSEKGLWSLTMDFFMKSGSGIEHVREKHLEKGYDKKDVETLLTKAGFKSVEVMEEYKVSQDGKRYLSRLYFIAQRQ